MIHAVIKFGKKRNGHCVCLTQTIEDVYFISIEGEIIENTLDEEEAFCLFDLTVTGYDFYNNFGGKYHE